MHKKIAFIGSVGTGKSTMINVLSSIETIKTEVESTVDIGKEMTTVGIDYGHINLGDDLTLGLYGVPGQKRFSFIWDFVKEGLWATIVLIKYGDEDSLNEMKYLLDYFEINSNSLCIIAMTHCDDMNDELFYNKVKQQSLENDLDVPIYRVNGRDKDDVLLIMNTLIALDENK